MKDPNLGIYFEEKRKLDKNLVKMAMMYSALV